MIKLQGLQKSYGNFQAVKGLDLEVPAGELFCFLGPNGAGKTTTIKMITGLARPDKGSIQIAGLDAMAQPVEAKRKMGYIPDTPYLYDRLTVEEFLRFVGELYHVPRRKQKELATAQIATFGLEEKRNALLKDLSHGMRQRVIYAATLMHNPQVLLVDEPFIGLDPYSIRLIKDLLRERTRRGMTVFMTTHILSIAEEIADRIGIIDRGVLVACGTLEEMKARPDFGGRLENLFLQLTLR